MIWKQSWVAFLTAWIVISLSPIKLWAGARCSIALNSNVKRSTSERGASLSEWSPVIDELVALTLRGQQEGAGASRAIMVKALLQEKHRELAKSVGPEMADAIFKEMQGRVMEALLRKKQGGRREQSRAATNDNKQKALEIKTFKPAIEQVFKAHNKRFLSAVFSSDGSKVLTGATDKTANLWDTVSGQELLTFSGHEGLLFSAVFSPDGSKVLTASTDMTAKLWNALTGSELLTFFGHQGVVFSAEFSPDGSKVLTASSDKTAKLWDAVSGTELHTFSRHSDMVNSAVFSPDGRRILTASSDNSAKLWDAVTGRVIRTFSPHNWVQRLLRFSVGRGDKINSAAFSPDGSKVLTASNDGKVKLWDAESGKEIRTFLGHGNGGRGAGVRSAVFSTDGRKILTASEDGAAMLWDAESGQELHTFSGPLTWVRSAEFSSDGSKVVISSDEGTAKIWALYGDVILDSYFAGDNSNRVGSFNRGEDEVH